ASGAVYKGIALTNNPDYVYAANFSAGTIDVYDGTWAKATLTGSFKDPSVPAGFAPFNIQLLAGKLYVAYAKQDPTKTLNVNGAGAGYVAVFDTNGNLIKHLISTGSLNAPWGLAIAPPSFGTFANALLVGNFGDGKINAFDVNSGSLLGTLQDPAGNPIVNLGLWALTFGTSTAGNYSTTLYFTAGIPGNGGVIQSHGLFGAITTTAPPSIGTNGIVNGASFAAGALAPGSIAAVFGTNLTDNGSSCLPPACNPTFRSDKRLTATLAGTQVQVNGVPAPLFYASPIQLGIQIPTELTAGGTATVQVIVDGQASTASTINIGEFSPGIFAGAITHANNTAVTTANPAAVRETVIIYANGLGATSAAVPTGQVPSGTVTTLTTPSVTIDGLTAEVDFSGLAGCCVGLNQINVVVPSGVRSGTNVPVIVSVGTQASNTVNMATK
ncbi:MAG TPA: TIGR03118 family protein, partial [Pirellulales bacterium]|nr:TIGR03118 family protein [Pirellulales bacterium]